MRLIDADALFNDLKASAKSAREWREEAKDEEIKIRAEQAHGTFVECALRVKNAPTIEAEPVRHGRWIKSDVYTFKKCSECGAIWDAALCENIFFIYRPRCGSKNGGADNG